ncbi:MAG: hypothetical protein CMH56_10510 [Myxococcales bacterium]|nr:hypothetical protein [Myxococcales bacterium]
MKSFAFGLLALLLTACPTQLEVDNSQDQGLLPIGPDFNDPPPTDTNHTVDAGKSPSQAHDPLDSGVDVASAPSDAGNASIPDNGDGHGNQIITEPTMHQDAGIATLAPTDAGHSEVTQPVVDAGSNSDGHTEQPWTDPDYPDGPNMQGAYLYERLPIGGFGEGAAVAIHPDGDYALIAERVDIVHVMQFSTMQTTKFELSSSSNYTFSDIRFHPNGHAALLVGHQKNGSSTQGLLIHFDDAAWRSGSTDANVLFTPMADVPDALKIPALRFSQNPTEPAVLLFITGSSNKLATLRQYDLELNEYVWLGTTSTASVEMTDITLVKNEFNGFGVLVVGGHSGATFKYYTEIGGVAEWRNEPGNSNTGNLSYAESHPSGDYALPINWSSGKLYRFENGNMCSSDDALSYSINNVRSIAWEPNGQRALIFGRTYGSDGSIHEFRHDRFECSYQSCAIGYVPITNFTASPYFADSNTYLVDGAWRSDCVGGLLVSNDPGMVITFQVEGQANCWD